MNWPDGKPYHSLNLHYRELFGEKTYKIALDIGTTCPNRDGTLSTKGCVYCSASGSGDFAAALGTSVTEQIDRAITGIQNKYSGSSYIAYLQSYSNTYGDTDHLLSLYKEILSDARIKGLAIGTRPDCLDEAILNGIQALSENHPIWVELGLQTIHEDSAAYINRCYDLRVFEDAVSALHKRKIPVVVHLIAGLPTEDSERFLASVRYLSRMPIAGIKFHMLHVLKGTTMGDDFLQNPFQLPSKEEYCNIICEAIALLPPDVVIHRLTGDAPKDQLIAPQWTLNKRGVLNMIHRTFKTRQLWQGKYTDI